MAGRNLARLGGVCGLLRAPDGAGLRGGIPGRADADVERETR